ncbi:MAG TPA: nuclear transport factor 2 family protein [Cyclobacteriaceae bacterium]|jgi:hypothetical protein|nr:nuclear transport factor 2 family protein [Cyclobacteriaceae bacterium]
MKLFPSVVILFFVSFFLYSQINDNRASDRAVLSKLNAQFIKNYITHDTVAHNEIIHKDFVCIENNGTIENRKEYMKNWATDYPNAGFTAFGYKDEFIRFFGDVALVRSKSYYTRLKNGKTINGSSIYTDTYKKENGRWWCIQAQITPNVSE